METLLAALDHQRAGRLDEAERLYGTLDGDDPLVAFHHGLLHFQRSDWGTAARLFSRVARARPEDGRARRYAARAWLADGRPERALALLDGAGEGAEKDAEEALLRGSALNALGRPAEAAGRLREAIALRPNDPEAQINLGNALADLDDLPGAEAAIRRGLALHPGLAEGWASLGFVLTMLGRLEEAIMACERAMHADPTLVQARWNLGIAALLAGDWDRGWAEFERRHEHPRFGKLMAALPGPVWRGEPLADATILVHAEQGLGDAIMFARFLPILAGMGARVVLACDRRLTRLLGRVPAITVVDRTGALPHYDFWINQMSLPGRLGVRPGTVPAADGYLTADPSRVAVWRERLGGIRRGLVWAGNPAHANDRRRSMPRAALASLLRAVPGGWAGLQVGTRHAEAEEIAGVPDLSTWLTDYGETAAAITGLDLLVTVDTSVAHVAGALGVPCWVMLPHAPEWRWMTGRDDTPWYTSLCLFRQERAGDWEGVIARVATALGEL